jgi:thiol-disulfide isomerase/thioredoxin
MLPLRLLRVLAASATAVILPAGCGAGAPSSARGNYPEIAIFRDRPAAPPVSGPLDGGGRLSLAADRGHVVVLNFWASWCSACRAEAPGLGRADRRLAGSGTRFVGVDVEDDQASALAFMRQFRIGYPSVADPGDAIVLNFHKIIPITEFPSTVVLSGDGHIVARVIGEATYPVLATLIKKAER